MAATVIANRDRSPLTREQLAHGIPAAFAEAPHESRSNRYLYVPTVQMLDALAREGFEPVWASQSRTRDASRQEYTKHMIRFAHPSAGAMVNVGDARPEVVLVNSHDGTSSVQLSAGVFRLVCSNGMIAGNISEQYRLQHSAKWRDEIIEGTYRVLDNLSGPVAEEVTTMAERQLTEPERVLLAEHAASLRWRDDAPPVTPAQLLTPRRTADQEATAWNTLNVLQENTVRGGIVYHPDPARPWQRRSTRPITGIDDLTRLNRGIWDAVATLATGNRVDLAREVFSRLTAEERAQLALALA